MQYLIIFSLIFCISAYAQKLNPLKDHNPVVFHYIEDYLGLRLASCESKP
jgi:hypothetical protein